MLRGLGQGTADTTVAYTGKKSSNADKDEPDIQTWREEWATRNGCTSTTPTSTRSAFANTTRYEWNSACDHKA